MYESFGHFFRVRKQDNLDGKNPNKQIKSRYKNERTTKYIK